MNENIYDRIQQSLTWKRIISFNLVLFLVLIVPISIQLAKQNTEFRSGAAGEVEPAAIIPPANYPVNPPSIDRVSTFFGKTGDTIVILGANFGDYQWESKVFVGNTEAPKDAVVRWSNNVIEVKIPDGARTGQVWINSNSREAKWEGSLLLYDVARAAQIGMQKVSATTGKVYTVNASGVVRGMIELAYVSEPLVIGPLNGLTITGQTQSTDSLGKKMKITFETAPLQSTKTELLDYSYPGLGTIEIIRAEVFDASGKLLPIFSNPLAIKVTP